MCIKHSVATLAKLYRKDTETFIPCFHVLTSKYGKIMPKLRRAQIVSVLTLPKFGITVLKLLNKTGHYALQKVKLKNIVNLLNYKECFSFFVYRYHLLIFIFLATYLPLQSKDCRNC